MLFSCKGEGGGEDSVGRFSDIGTVMVVVMIGRWNGSSALTLLLVVVVVSVG